MKGTYGRSDRFLRQGWIKVLRRDESREKVKFLNSYVDRSCETRWRGGARWTHMHCCVHNFESAKGKSLILVVVTLGIPFDLRFPQ